MYDMKRLGAIATIIALSYVMVTAPAFAAGEPNAAPSRTEVVSGFDAVAELIEGIGSVSFDSAGATFALMSQTGPRSISFTYRDLVPEVVGGTGTGLIPYATLAFAVLLFTRFLRLVLRLAR